MGRGVRSGCGTRTWWVGAAVGLHGVFVPSAASAQPAERSERELIHVDYEADASCPSLDELLAKVRTYTSRWALADDGGKVRRFRVVLAPGEGRFVGVLEIVEPSGDAGADTSASRTITGPDCETVARGMAIAVAVAIDPSALFGAHSAEEPVPPAPAAATPTSRSREKAHQPPPAPAAPPSRGPTFAVDARGELTSAVVTGFMPVLSIGFELDPLSSKPVERLPRWFRPAVAVGIRQSLSRSIERETVTTEFAWTAAVLRLCPARFVAAGDRLEVTPCLEANAGALRASARGSPDARSTSNPWIDGGLSARATWSLGGEWFVSGAASLVVPVSRNRFELSTGTLISRAPSLGVTLGLGGGVRF